MIQVCVINLKRRQDRRVRFSQLNSHSELNFIWIEAIEGKELDRSELLKQNLITRRHQHFSAGQIGCSLSHRALWHSCIQQNQPLVVCEDDAILRQDFATALNNLYSQLPHNWDFVLFNTFAKIITNWYKCSKVQ